MSFDPTDRNRAFAEKYGFPFRLLSDPDRKIGLAYGACDTPDAPAARRISFLIGADGVIRAAWGQTSKIDTRAHADEVLRALA